MKKARCVAPSGRVIHARMATTENAPPREYPDELSMCCGKKKCPKIRLLSDGSVEISDPDVGAAPVVLDAERAGIVRAWLAEREF